jgi:energy-coupling factor transporter ATP-binding protein EcfA2
MNDRSLLLNPFPGLRPFEPNESHLFFGRDGQRQELINRLWESRFLAVIGTSGSGKSSLVRAGLLPTLQSGLMPGAGSAWRFAIMRPGNNPIRELARALADRRSLNGEKHSMFSVDWVENELKRSSLGLVNIVREARCKLDEDRRPLLADDENLLVIVDQFEELFRFKRLAKDNAEERDHASSFVNLLLSVVEQDRNPLRLYVALTMRSEYLGESAQFPGLPEAVSKGEYLIPRMSRDERRAAIVGPIAVGGAAVSEALVSRLLNDMGEDPDQLPVLQHALMRTWEEWRDRGQDERLDMRHYEKIGGMGTALSRHAETTLAEFCDPNGTGHPAENRLRIAQRVFKALTELGPDNKAIRRPVRLGELIKITQEPEEGVRELIEVFRKPGRSFLMPPSADPLELETVIDISHESLLRMWQQVRVWSLEEAESARIYRRLAETAALKEKGGEGFLRDPALQIALEWEKRTTPNEFWAARYHGGYATALEYLKASERERSLAIEKEKRQRLADLDREKRNNLKLKWYLGVACLFFVFAVITAWLAWQQNGKLEVANRDLKVARDKEKDALTTVVIETEANERQRMLGKWYHSAIGLPDASGSKELKKTSMIEIRNYYADLQDKDREVEILVYMGEYLVNENDGREALKYFNDALPLIGEERFRWRAHVHAGMGRAHENLRRWGDASKAYDAAAGYFGKALDDGNQKIYLAKKRMMAAR